MKYFILTILSTLILLSSCNQNKVKQKRLDYPETRKDTITDNYFGTKVADPYRWLEDDNSEETKAWVNAENKVTFNYLHKIPFRQKIIDRLTVIYNYETYLTPFKKAGKYFYFKNDGLQNQDILYMQDGLDRDPKILLDPNKFSDDGTIALSRTGISISKDGKYLAYSVTQGGSDWNVIFVKNIENGTLLNDKIEWVKFSNVSWKGNGFFYSRYPNPGKDNALTKTNQFQKVYYHKIGTSQSNDKLIIEDKNNPSRKFTTFVTDDEKYLIITFRETTSGKGLYYKNLENNSEFKLIADGFDYYYNVIGNVDDKFYIHTNENAPRYKLISYDIKTGKKEDIIPEKNEVLRTVKIGSSKLIASYMEDAKSKVFIYDIDGKNEKQLELPGIGTMGKFSSEKGNNIAFYSFTSYTYPSVIFKYDFNTGKSEIYKKPNIKGVNLDDYVTEQVFFNSKDGTKIPMFLTHKKGIKLNGNNPTLLYAYGGFNISITPRFSVSRMIWLENGGVFAVANIRGGGEYGEEWHKAGTLQNKQNVFDDFIAAAEYLIGKKYTTHKKLVIEGGSNGGLLVGVVTNQRPDLFAVSLTHVGVLDMLRYQYFTIGRAWSADYGLSEDSIMFPYLYKYSPVHNIKEDVEYPAVLVLTADHDDRVVPAHSFKYIATLQDKYKGNHPTIIRIEKKAGHGAGKPISKQIEEQSDIYAFAFKNIGVIPYEHINW